MSELSESNFKRISIINWLLSVPLMVLFAWPYFYAARLLGMDETLRYVGAFMFAVPFMMTILHGHVTIALGSAHRDLYYKWMIDHPYTYGLFFSRWEISTRFRLVLLVLSLIFLPVGYLLSF